MKKLNKDVLVFLDLETTGLDPHSEHILEIGITLWNRTTDTVLGSRSWVTRPHRGDSPESHFFQLTEVDQLKERASEVVREMHTKSGLWDELESSELTLTDAGRQIPEWLLSHGLDINNELFTLAGNGPDRFDRLFLRANAEALNYLDGLFHYRSLDISNLYFGLLFAGADLNDPSRGRLRPPTAHRAVADCLQSLEDFKWVQGFNIGGCNYDCSHCHPEEDGD